MARVRLHRWTEGPNPKIVAAMAAATKPVRRAKPTSTRVDAAIGIDLSLRAAAVCAIPFGWNQDLTKIRTLKVGYSLTKTATARERIERLSLIANEIVIFCRDAKASHVGIEDYAYSKQSGSMHQTVECGGALKVAILELLNIATTPISASSARKVLLQHVPRLGAGKTKPWVVRNVKRLGGPTLAWTDDECDAFVVANTVLERGGGMALSFAGE